MEQEIENELRRLIDEIGTLQEQIAPLTKKLEDRKRTLLEKYNGSDNLAIEGELYSGQILFSQRRILDNDVLASVVSPDVLESCYKNINIRTVKTKPRT